MVDKKARFTLKGRDQVTSTFRRVARSFKDLANNFRIVHEAGERLFRSIAGGIRAFADLAKRGGEVVAVKRAFARTTENATAALKLLRRETFGLIDNFELMRQQNTAIALGSAKTTEQFAEMAQVAIGLGRALGIDATFALNSLNTGIARQSRLYLDNIGIILSVGEANRTYAESIGKTTAQLTDNEKRLAFRNAAMDAARSKIEALGGVELSAADKVHQAGIAVKNFTIKLAAMVAQSPFIDKLFTKLASLATDMVTILGSSKQDIVDTLKDLGGAAGNAFSIAFLRGLQLIETGARELVAKLRRDHPILFAEDPLKKAGRAVRSVGQVISQGPQGLLAGLQARQAGISPEPTSLFSKALAKAEANLESFSDSLAERIARLRGPELRPGGGGVPPVTPPGTPGVVPAIPGSVTGSPVPFVAGSFGRGGANAITGQNQFLGGILRNQQATEAQRLAEEAQKAAQGLDVLGQSVVTNFSQMAAAAIAGSAQMEQVVISAFTNILSSLPGVGGFGGALIGAVGGLFGGLFGGGRRDPVPVRIAHVDPGAVQDLQTGPSTVILQLIQDGVTIEEIEYELRRRQNTDQKIRIPRGVSF